MTTDRANLPLDRAHQIDAVSDRFEAGWRAGQRLRIEEYLAEEDAATRRALLHDLLAAEVECRLRFGERPTPGEYRDRFRGDEPVVDAVFESLVLPDTVGAPPLADGPDRIALPQVPGFEILEELG